MEMFPQGGANFIPKNVPRFTPNSALEYNPIK